MGLVEKYPYTNFAGVNLDYILNEIEALKKSEGMPAGYIHDVIISDGVITFKNGAGETVATVDTVKRAIKDDDNQDITGYIRNITRNGKEGFYAYNGEGQFLNIKYPKFVMKATKNSAMSSTYTIDSSSYNDFTNFIADVEEGYPCRLVLYDEEENLEFAAPVYFANGGYFMDVMTDAGSEYTWKSFGLTFTSAGVPAVETVTLSQVN